jgi:hypothetical protein
VTSHIKVLTEMHLSAARAMPRKVHPLLIGDRAKQFSRASKRERNVIARYYRYTRNSPEHGRLQASIAHRYRVVVTGSEARQRTPKEPHAAQVVRQEAPRSAS